MSLIDDLKKHEGFKPTVYEDTEGYDTIGYGFAIKDLYLSKEVCDIILIEKIAELKLNITKKFEWFEHSPDVIKDAVTNMCYQMGVSGFSKFKQTIYYLETEQYEEAADEMLDSLWAKQTPHRAKELSDIIRSLNGHNKSSN